MLLIIADWLDQYIRAFNVLSYITLRAVLAALTALGIGLVLGPWVIRKLTDMKFGQAVRDDGPQTHLVKSGSLNRLTPLGVPMNSAHPCRSDSAGCRISCLTSGLI